MCAGTNQKSHFRQLEPSQQRVRLVENIADPDVMQQYVDYMILDPSQSSVRMQTPLLDPYTYRQVGPGHFKTYYFILLLILLLFIYFFYFCLNIIYFCQ